MRRPVPFGKYLLLDRISVGGMAEVFKAKSFGVQGFEKVIAIKRILPSMGQDDEFIKMFIDEAKIAGQLAHANIGQIHELGQIDGSHFIAMEYIWGRDLLQLQNRFKKLKRRLPTTAAAFIVMKICEGLHYAHKKRDVLGSAMEIVHRDCSPQNVVVSYEGEVKLIDFGIARAASRSARTNAGVLKGKFGYMSPEQVRGLPLDRRSDIFSLGIILFETLTGKRLFNGESDFSTLEKVRNAEVDAQLLVEAGVPEQLQRITIKALRRTPDDRYQWCSDMRDDLRNYLQTTSEAYSYRTLGEEMRAAFGPELAREQELMDVYAKIGKGGITQELFEQAQVLVGGDESSIEGYEDSGVLRAREHALARGSQPRRATSRDDFEDHPTEIFGEVGIQELIGEASDRGQAQPLIAELGEIKVHVADDTGTPPPTTYPGQGGGDASPLVSFVEKAVASVGPVDASGYTGTERATLPQPGRRAVGIKPRRGMRDLLIGGSVALAAVLLLVAVKVLFFSSEAKTPAARATLVVLVGDKTAADVFLGDKKIGAVPAGDPLTVEDLTPGSYTIRVSRAGAVACDEEIKLDAERIEVFNCDFASERQGRLQLTDLRADDVVIVDGKMVSAGALQGGLELVAGRLHSIAVTREGNLIDEFDVTLKGKEQFYHKVRVPEVAVAEDESMEMTPDLIERKSSEEVAVKEPKPERGTSSLLGLDSRDPERPKNKAPSNNELEKPELTKPRVDKSGVDKSGELSPENEDKAPADTHGYLTAWTRPWARVHVDGKDTGKVTPIAPAARIKLSPGSHQVTFIVGSKSHDFTVEIKAGEETKLAKILE